MKRRSFRVGVVLTLWACAALSCSSGPAREGRGPLAERATDLHEQGQRFLLRGDTVRAKTVFEKSRRLAESLDDRLGLILALNDLGAA